MCIVQLRSGSTVWMVCLDFYTAVHTHISVDQKHVRLLSLAMAVLS